MNLKVLYQTPILKLMNILVFVDSFILILLGVGIKGNQGLAFGAAYGFIGGITAIIAFDTIIMTVISVNTRKQSKA